MTVSSDGPVTPSPIALKREVSLMRVRLNVKDKEGNTNNENTANGVDFAQDASIMIYRLPDHLKVMAGNAGGVSATSLLLIYCLFRVVRSLKQLILHPVIMQEVKF